MATTKKTTTKANKKPVAKKNATTTKKTTKKANVKATSKKTTTKASNTKKTAANKQKPSGLFTWLFGDRG